MTHNYELIYRVEFGHNTHDFQSADGAEAFCRAMEWKYPDAPKPTVSVCVCEGGAYGAVVFQRPAECDSIPKMRVCRKVAEAVDAYTALHNVVEWLTDNEVEQAAKGEYAAHARRAIILAMECMSDAFPDAVDEFYDKQAMMLEEEQESNE